MALRLRVLAKKQAVTSEKKPASPSADGDATKDISNDKLNAAPQHRVDHPFTADILELHLPNAVELERFWKSGLENLTRGPPNKPSDTSSRKMPRKSIPGLKTKLTQVLEPNHIHRRCTW